MTGNRNKKHIQGIDLVGV